MTIKNETVKILEEFDGDKRVKEMLTNIIKSIHIIEHDAWARGYRECHESHLKIVRNLDIDKKGEVHE